MKSKNLIVPIACLLSLLCSARIVCAQLEKDTAMHLPRVQGAVYDKTGKPIAGAKVELVRNDAVKYAVTTDEAGGFRIEHVNGRYVLHVVDEKYSPAAKDILVGFELASAPQNRNLFVLLGPSACSESCSTVTTSKKEFERIVHWNSRH